jgi:hypothetical protein
MKGMMKQIILALTFALMCANSPAISAAEPAVAEGVATVVFMRSSLVGMAIKTSVYEVTNGETKFIGIMKNKNKINYETTPGKHTFMVVSEAADFMQAEVISGKTYYSMITPRTGAWKARFSMIPIRNDGTTDFNTGSEKFEKWKKKTKVVSMNEKSLAWYEKHKASVEEKRAKYWEKWLQKSADDLSARTLKPDDGL